MSTLQPYSPDSQVLTPADRRSLGVPGRSGGRSHNDSGGASDLHLYLQILRSRWRLIAAVTTTVVLAVAVGTFLQTPIYRASGLVELRGQSSEGVDVEALFQPQRLSIQFLETQYELLRSAALAERAFAAAGLLTTPGSVHNGSEASPVRTAAAPTGQTPESARRDEVNLLSRALIVEPLTGSNLVRVHYESDDPELAARVVNSFIKSYTEMRAEAARAAVARLGAEVDTVRDRLAESERSLLQFARDNGLPVGPRNGTSEDLPHARLRILQQQLAEADAARYSQESLFQLVRTRNEGLLDSEILQALHVRLAGLRSEHARLSATFLEDYPKTRELQQQIDEVETLLTREQGRLREAITSRYNAAVRHQQLLQRAVDEQRALVDGLGERNAEYGILAREVEAQQDLYARLQDRLRAAEVSAAVATTDVNVVEPAVAPTSPVRPVPSTNLTLAFMVGLVMGVGAAFLREHVDVTVRTVHDLETIHVPLLGLIPSAPNVAARSVNRADRKFAARLKLPRQAASREAIEFEQTALKDAFLSLRTAVLMAEGNARTPRSLLVTSARPGDGKTTIAANLAVSLARLNQRVLLVDADLRRPALHRAFSRRRGRGLSEYLRGEESWSSLVHLDAAAGVDLLLAGDAQGAPTELLASDRAAQLLEEAREIYDCVVVDSPALGINAADTRILSSIVDGVVMVVRSGSTPRALVGSMLRNSSNVVGVVLNDVDPSQFPAYYYSYGQELDQAAST
jgi:succinoglycan biosynthesis transport protein ExoP